jgi:hypothetical protein
MREVFASINYVINKLEEKNLFKIAQEGHDIFAAVYRFIRDEQNGLKPDMNASEIDENLKKVEPSNLSEKDLNVLYEPGTKFRNRNWRVKTEDGFSLPTEINFEKETSSETPSAGPSVAPESASTTTSTTPGPGTSSITVTTPSSYSGTEGTSSESSSSTSTPSGSGPSFNMGSGETSVDPTKVEYFNITTLLDIVEHLVRVGKAITGDIIRELDLGNNEGFAAVEILMKLGVAKKTNYNVELTKPKDQVFKILTQYMLHHKDKQPKDEIIDVDVEDPNEDTNEVRQIGERNNPASDETKIPGGSFGSENRSSGGWFGGGQGQGGFGGGSERRRKVYPSTMEEIRKTQEKLDVIVKELDKILKMPNDRKTKGVFTNFLSNKDLVDIVSDPNFEQNYSINSDTMMNIEFIHYPGENIVGLKINGEPVIQFGKRR